MIRNNISRRRFIRVILILVLILSAVVIFYCCERKENKLSNSQYIYLYPNSSEKNNVFVEAKVLKCQESLKVFGCKLCKYGIQPVSFVIDNKSSGTYYFAKREVSPKYMRAQESFLKCFGQKNIGTGGISILRDKFKSINAKKKHIYLSKEMADDFVCPQKIKKGVLFFAQFKKAEKLIIPLVNKNNGERIIFEFLVN